MKPVRVTGEYRCWWGRWEWRYTAFCRRCSWHTGSYPAWFFQRAFSKGEKHIEEHGAR